MKNTFPHILTAAIMLTTFLSGACKKDSPGNLKQTTFNTPFDLQLTEKIMVASADRHLMVELRSLNDNRCAEQPCEHGEMATTRVFISDSDHHAEAETNLCIGMCDVENKTTDTVYITLDKVNYTLVLKRIFGSSDKKAEFEVNLD